MKPSRILVLLAFAACTALFFVFDLHRFLTVDHLATRWDAIAAFEQRRPWTTALAFFAAYVLITGLSLPGAALLTLVAGALFGFVQGRGVVVCLGRRR